MAKETGKNFKGGTKKEVILWLIYLLIGFVASVIVASMGYIFYVGNHMIEIHTTLMDAVMEIRIETATAHLRFEEIISDDRQESIDTVWEHLDEADWYAQAMLVGGKNPHWKYKPVDDARIRREVEIIQAKLAEFRAITQERFKAPPDSPVGSEIDQKYEAVFAELVNAAEQVETEIKQMIRPDLRNFQVLQTVLIFICVVLTVLVGIVISRFMRRQIRDELKLQAANQQLNAANQQLRAHEQQLKASNQQLRANEQQLVSEISERKQAEEAVRKERDKAQKYLDVAGLMLVAIDVEERVGLINKKGCEILGYEEEEIIGKKWFDNFLPQRIKHQVRGVFEKLVGEEADAPEYYENLILTKDGDERLIAWHNTILRTEQGDIIGTLSSGEDITERMRAEEALQKSQSLLNETGKMAKVGGWEFDVETLEQVWTEEVYRIHEVDSHYKPTVEAGISFYAPESRPIIANAAQKAIDNGEPFDVELQFITAKGNHRWVHAIGKAHQQGGKTIKVSGTFQDITERKRAEEALAGRQPAANSK